MHISEGVLTLPVLAGGWVFTVAGLALSIKRLPWAHLNTVGILSAAFFVASLIHIPLGPGNVHLVLNGLLGVILGLAAFPAIFIALLLQAVLFQYGGLSSLGVNTCIMALPAVVCGLVCRPFLVSPAISSAPSVKPMHLKQKVAAFLCGGVTVLCSTLLCALALVSSGDIFTVTAWALVLANIPVILLEGTITLFATAYLSRALPEILAPREF